MSDHGNWRRPSGCANTECVEVGECRDGHIEIRNSRYPDEFLAFARDEWAAFVAAVKAGEYDDLTDQPDPRDRVHLIPDEDLVVVADSKFGTGLDTWDF